ncbi:zinc ribbon domain-containing protein [Thermoanaerobacter sp. CM-CNRG TB177]|nr:MULTISPECIES: zinc ribbon domain-containing protein [Thermoanaerobacter]MBT1278536.1 transposase [Thermoanaerobacter sp. CM-CNRG TB177]
MYVCQNCGIVVNGDVNGAVNILRRVSPNLKKDRGRGFLDNPVRIKVS